MKTRDVPKLTKVDAGVCVWLLNTPHAVYARPVGGSSLSPHRPYPNPSTGPVVPESRLKRLERMGALVKCRVPHDHHPSRTKCIEWRLAPPGRTAADRWVADTPGRKARAERASQRRYDRGQELITATLRRREWEQIVRGMKDVFKHGGDFDGMHPGPVGQLALKLDDAIKSAARIARTAKARGGAR